MTGQIAFLTLGSWSVSVYGLILTAAVGAGFLWMLICARRTGLPADATIRFGLWAIPLGLIGGRALFVAVRWNLVVHELGWMQIFRLWDGGFALFGVIPGCLLAVVICAKRMHLRTAGLLDAAAPGAALALSWIRFAEYFTLQGSGRPVDVPVLQWFPLAMQNAYGDWIMPVFVWEGLAALVIASLAYNAIRSPQRRPLDAFFVFLIGISAAQVLLESLRTDDILRFGLVRVSQLTAMLCILTVAGYRIVKAKQAGQTLSMLSLHGASILLGVGICVGIEFALDKTTVNNTLLYGIMAITIAGMLALVGRMKKKAAQ